ncbi:MAG TPA: class I SAM-dependent methyltransferase [Solirubrobacterales bacterium]|nr:class I SAM-dependent methyltransferase [Solirubrobacterales bacterium]
MSEQPEHVARNRAFWNGVAAEWVQPGRDDWAAEEPRWGVFRVPEAELGVLPSELEGKEAIELGCGTGYVSSWLARRGARPTGIDNSEEQLATARALQREFGIEFPLLHGDAEQVPLADAGFDFAISEYGASIWCDPYRWIPEASRLLRPGGELVFLVNSVFTMLCGPDDENEPATDRMIRPYFGMRRYEWPDGSVEIHLPHGEMIAVLRESGFEVEELIEVRPREGATTRFSQFDLAWARRWPVEEVWRARKRA